MSGGLAKPDLAAYANVSIYACGTRVFNGTSAATPHVSGATALLRSAYPTCNRGQIIGLLKELAVDLGVPGYDYEYGQGRLYLGNPSTAGGCPYRLRVFLPYVVRP